MSAEEAVAAKNRGNKLVQEGKFAEAVAEFSTAISLDPKNAVYFSNRSMAYAEMGKFDEALNDAKQAISIDPKWPKGYARAGLALFRQEKFEEAKKAYSDGLVHAPNDEGLKAGVKQCDDMMDPMRSMFGDKMWQRLAADPSTRHLLNDPDARRKLQALQSNPQMMLNSLLTDPKLANALPVILGLPKDFAARAGAAKPGAAASSGNSSASRMEDEADGAVSDANEFDEDEQDVPMAKPSAKPAPKQSAEPRKEPEPEPEPELTAEEKAKLERKKEAAAEKELGNSLFVKKQFEEALKHYDRAIEFDPTDAIMFSNKAAVYMQQEKYQDAIDVSRKGLEVAHEHKTDYKTVAKLYLRIANAAEKMGNLDLAIESVEKSLLENNDDTTRRLLKTLKERKKQIEEQAYINPELSMRHKESGDKLFQEGKFAEAIQEYSEALKRDPKNVRVLSNRAASYTKLMQWGLAMEDCDNLIKLDPLFVKGYVRKAKVQIFLKQFHKALETVDRGLSHDQGNAELMQMRQEIMIAVQTSDDDPKRAEEAMKDPEIQAIMRDPTMRRVLDDLQSKDQRAIQAALSDKDVRAKLDKLIAAGIIRLK